MIPRGAGKRRPKRLGESCMRAYRRANCDRRAKAVRALGLLTGSAEAEKAAVQGLQDEKPNVRLAAAAALGSMHAEQAAGNVEEALGDSEPSVVLAAANSLLLLHDDVGYDTYYEVLTGEKRASKGLIKDQPDTLKDKKKMAQLGFEEGIGFIPFAGIGYEVFKTVTKDDSSPLHAAAATKLFETLNPFHKPRCGASVCRGRGGRQQGNLYA